MTTPTEWLDAAPILASLDIAATARFYTQKLGFAVTYQDADYAIVKRDGLQLHFWKCDDPAIPANTGCYIYVRHIDTLYHTCQQAGVIHPNGALESKPWGLREFAVLDGDGNLLRFGEVMG